MTYEKDAAAIVAAVGGEDNITSLYHCVTRLRFGLVDRARVDEAAVRAVGAVQAINDSGQQFQVIIGNDVPKVFAAVKETHPGLVAKVNDPNADDADAAGAPAASGGTIRDRFFGFLSKTFPPLLPAIAGAGLIKGLLALAVWLGWMSTETQTYQLLFALGDAFFFFLPVMIAISAARVFQTNVFVAAALSGALVYPNLAALLAAGDPVTFLGLPVTATTYSYTVIPALLAVWALSWVERGLKKVLPAALHLSVVPLVSMLVVGPVTLVALGPLGAIIGDQISGGLNWLLTHGGVFSGILLGAVMSLIIMTGMHAALVPFILGNLATLGNDPFLPLTYVQIFSVAGALFGVAIRARSRQVRATSLSTGFTALMGVSEPGLFGLLLPMRRVFLASMIGGAAGGAIALGFGAKAYALVGNSGLPGLPGLAGPAFGWSVAAIAVSFVGALVAVLVIGFDESPLTRGAAAAGSTGVADPAPAAATGAAVALDGGPVVASPVAGTVVPLAEVGDGAFASGAMGKGVGVLPTDGEVVAPVSGTVVTVFPTKHVVGLKSDEGVEVLVHVGVDTVNLGGRGFTAHVADGDRVSVGDRLLTVDLPAVAATHDTTTVVVVTNATAYAGVEPIAAGTVAAGAGLLAVETLEHALETTR
ncbi:glucose PTS transporter subunit IIA [Cellulomonas sp. Y8]|uniref:glucose PTS transporter subunit IIA n=1 Tax=Cellulomonas sp. Y8 TaxID=2591145 RepID=UPI0011C9F4C1|nr:glucose PTS transporter subunit IIA [Cellulomonas sp. Y8]